MAKRFKKEPVNFSTQGMLLFLLPLPLLAAVVMALTKGYFSALMINGAAYGLFLGAAALMRIGLANEADYNRRRVATPPPIPFKIIAGIETALAVFVVAYWGASYSLIIALCFAVGALAGCYLTYGLDPRKEKTIEGQHGVTTAEVVEALEQAEDVIKAIDDANKNIENQELSERLSRISVLAHKILKVIEQDPRDLRRARKFLTTYLEGAQRVSQGYANTHQQCLSAELEDNFRRVLVTIEEVFEEQHSKLLENDILDLDVQIEVLRTQLKREGVI